MTDLDFPQFFRELHGHLPFPWQSHLAAQVLDEDQWPDLIDVPTGLGKTSTTDVAVFSLAAIAGSGQAGRRRIFFVVDRRIVVDEAFDHALAMADQLNHAPVGSQCALVADRLGQLQAGDAPRPLGVTRMRGGATWADNWVDRPDRPTIVVGTVDQIGSRLFFRGYQTSDRRKPMDAALVGTDSLILIDEAHLAEPMINSINAAFAEDQHGVAVPRATVVQLTATGRTSGRRFAFDLPAHEDDEIAHRRLTAPKALHLAVTPPKKRASAMARLMADLLAERPGARGLIVCNTIGTARATWGALTKDLRADGTLGRDSAGPELLIGRARQYDRDQRTPRVLARFGVGRDRSAAGVDVLVATQTVEVGANLDVDVLVTESAPLDSLIQRLGRLNRLGESICAPVAVVVHDENEDPVYGPPRAAAWSFLVNEVGVAYDLASEMPQPWPSVDASPLSARAWATRAPQDAIAARPHTPLLLRAVPDAWARTAPIAEPDPPTAPYLHGLQAEPTNVVLLWRDDLVEGDESTWPDRLDTLPWTSEETVEVPIGAAAAWLQGGKSPNVADVDSAVVPEPEDAQRRTVAVRRSDTWELTRTLRPGQVIALPALWGGLDEFGWNPDSAEPVVDVREQIGHRRGRTVLRLDRHTPSRVLAEPNADNASDDLADLARQIGRADDRVDANSRIEQVLASLLSRPVETLRNGYREIIADLLGDRRRPFIEVGDDVEQIILQSRVKQAADSADLADDAGELTSSTSLSPVTLAMHHRAVGQRARDIANALGIGDDLAAVVAEAGACHDLGKHDLRFQAALLDGDLLRAEILDEPLAKSGREPRSIEARRARRRAQVPHSFRHETWSAALVAAALPPAGQRTVLDELLIHLVASHHGHSRPLLPPVLDDQPRIITAEVRGQTVEVATHSRNSVDWTAPARFQLLNEHLGRWGLALLETIVRSADQTCSKEGT